MFFCFFYFRLYSYLELSFLQSVQKDLQVFYTQAPFVSALIYFSMYVLITGLSLPGATVFTLLGGMLFGLWKGVLLASLASITGALIAFSIVRYFFRVNGSPMFFAQKSKKLEMHKEKFLHKIKTEGIWYLFALRLIPLIPFFVVNILSALAPIKTRDFIWISWLGMLPATFLYVNAGAELSQLQSLKDVLSFSFILAFTLLGIFPLVMKYGFSYITARKKH